MIKFKNLLHENMVNNGNPLKLDDPLNFKITSDTLDQFTDIVQNENYELYERWCNLTIQFNGGYYILDSDEYDQTTKKFVLNHGANLYYNVDYNNSDETYNIYPLNSKDVLNVIESDKTF